ncbi:MAG: sugar phosphate nucleotidyltransferase, partial [Alphaproteobacteria bacterium]|nr:sugar phosphate nucleotidyltransferase [Alphaproteobacteria bacterium]
DVVACTGDNNPTADAIKLYEETGKSVVVANEVPMERVKNYGVLNLGKEGLTDDKAEVTGFVEKPSPEEAPSNLAILGRYVLTPRHMEILPSIKPGAGNEIQLTDAIDQVTKEEGCMGSVFRGQHFDCGDKVGFQMANLYFALRDDYIGPRLLPYLQATADKTNRRNTPRVA